MLYVPSAVHSEITVQQDLVSIAKTLMEMSHDQQHMTLVANISV